MTTRTMAARRRSMRRCAFACGGWAALLPGSALVRMPTGLEMWREQPLQLARGRPVQLAVGCARRVPSQPGMGGQR